MGFLDRFKRLTPREAFVKEYIGVLRRSGEQRAVEFNDADFSIVIKAVDGKAAAIRNLHNCYREYQKASGAEGKAVIVMYVRAMAQASLPKDWPSAMSMLRPSVKDRGQIESTYFQQKALSPATAEVLPSRILTTDLTVFPVLDLPESVAAVTAKHLREWGVGLDQVMETALHNFRADNAQVCFEAVGRLQLAQQGDSYDATRLLLTEQIATLGLEDRTVALVPDRELLILAGSTDLAALSDMANLAIKRFKEGVRGVSGRPIVLVDGAWRDFEPPECVAALFRQFRQLMDHRRYEDQADLLRKDMAARGEDVFVAKYTLGSQDGANHQSVATWSEGIVSLLPETDLISFYQASRKVLRRSSWDRAATVTPQRMESTDHYPARWRVSGFPTDEEFAAMGAETFEFTGGQWRRAAG